MWKIFLAPLLLSSSATALRALPIARASLHHRFSPMNMRAPSDSAIPAVRVVVRNTELLSASIAQKAVATAKKNGINSVSFGGLIMSFSHDMSSTFKAVGIVLALMLIKFLRKGKNIWKDEIQEYKDMDCNPGGKAELHEFQCENCECHTSSTRKLASTA